MVFKDDEKLGLLTAIVLFLRKWLQIIDSTGKIKIFWVDVQDIGLIATYHVHAIKSRRKRR